MNKDLLPIQIKECTLQDHKGASLQRKHKYNTRGKMNPYAPKANCKFYMDSIFCNSIKNFRTLKGKTQNLASLSLFTKQCKELILKGEIQ